MKKIGVLVSGGGTNLQAIIDAQNSGVITSGRVTCVIASKPDVYALTRAKENGIDSFVVEKKKCADLEEFDENVLKILEENQIDLVVMAGFLTIMGDKFIAAYRDRIINVHPALIPAFSGKGFYGMHVHKAVLEKGVKLTGATVHLVNEICDGGKIILQKAVEVMDDDTPQILQKRVMEQAEWDILPRAVELFCSGKI